MTTFHHYLSLIAYGSAGVTGLLVLTTRFLWRRGKALQEL